jgi:hypothetical protein
LVALLLQSWFGGAGALPNMPYIYMSDEEGSLKEFETRETRAAAT